jgi:hypothetical protein
MFNILLATGGGFMRPIVLPATMLAMFAADLEAQQTPCTPVIQNMAVSAGAQKCGYTECQPSVPPKYFLVSTYSASANISTAYYNAGVYSSGNSTLVYKEKDVSTTDPQTCSNGVVYSGTATSAYNNYLYSTNTSNGSSSSTKDPVTGAWSGGGNPASGVGDAVSDFTRKGAAHTKLICTSTISGSITTGSYSYPSISFESEWGNLNYTVETGLSQEYTDTKLRQVMVQKLPAYPTDYVTNWSNGSGTAFYSLDTNHLNCAGGRMKYKFYLCAIVSLAKGQSFTIKWKQMTTYPGSTNPPAIDKMQEDITGNGDPNGMYSSEHDVDVPGSPSSITVMDATIKAKPPSPPGNGGGGGGSGGHRGGGVSSGGTYSLGASNQ